MRPATTLTDTSLKEKQKTCSKISLDSQRRVFEQLEHELREVAPLGSDAVYDTYTHDDVDATISMESSGMLMVGGKQSDNTFRVGTTSLSVPPCS